MKLCTDCKHYKVGENENEDDCLHPQAEYGGVRAVKFYRCSSMRAGICGKGADLFEPSSAQVQP